MVAFADGAAPTLSSMGRIEALLGRDRRHLRRLAARAGGRYKPRDIVPVNGVGKRRHIEGGTSELTFVQRRIDQKILAHVALPETMLGGVRGKSILDNVRGHVGSREVLMVDLKDCFRRIDQRRVFSVFRDAVGAGTEVASLLTRLTTRNRALPQGAPTSTRLANLALVELHRDLASLARDRGLEVSQWVDDIAFSGDSVVGLKGLVVDAILRHGFAVRQRKARRMRSGERHEITGVIVNTKPSIGRHKIQAIRDEIVRLASSDGPAQYELASVWGRIYHTRFICSEQGTSLLDLAAVVGLPKKGTPGQRPTSIRFEPCHRHRWD